MSRDKDVEMRAEDLEVGNLFGVRGKTVLITVGRFKLLGG